MRRRRRDLALLKALGFTQGQLAAAVAWQATVAAAIGVVVGIPPDATVPATSVVLVAVGAFVFANLVAALPGRGAARTPTALVLRAE